MSTVTETVNQNAANDLLFGSGTPFVSWEVGLHVRFRILSQGSQHRRAVTFDRDKKIYVQGALQYWGPDKKPVDYQTDKPVLDPVITVQTDLSGWKGLSPQAKKTGRDTGKRQIVIKGRKAPGGLREAVLAACEVADVQLVPGGYAEIECYGKAEPEAKGMSGALLYRATWYGAGVKPEWADTIPETARPGQPLGASTADEPDPWS